MATHPWPVVPHIISPTSLGMPWWFAYPVRPGTTSWEVCGLNEGRFCLWIASHTYQTSLSCTCKKCEMGGNISMACCSSHNNILNLRMTWIFCSSHEIWYHSLGALWLGWKVPMYTDHVSSLYIHMEPNGYARNKIEQAMSTSHHITHLPEDGLVVCRSCKILPHSFGGQGHG
jgi:hypothetical protein